MSMTPEEVASLLAQSNALSTEPSSNVPVNTTPNITPEKAVELMDEVESREVTATGVEVVPEAVTEVTEEVVEEVDISKMSLSEKIEHFQALKDAEEAEANPLAEVDKQLEAKNIDLTALEQEYINEGALTEESLKSLKDAGFDQVAVDAYIATKEASAQAEVSTLITNVCGNQESFDAMAEWMQVDGNLTQAELDTYNKNVSGEHKAIYLENMYNKYKSATPTPARVLRANGSQVKTTATNTFNSQAEMVEAMQDPRYAKDPHYANTVRQKIARMN